MSAVEEVAWAPVDRFVWWLASGWRICGEGRALPHPCANHYSVLVWREVPA